MFSKSPKFPRQGHQQLKQDGVDDEDRVLAGVEFTVQYMGSIEVAGGCGTGSGNTDMPVAQVMAPKAKSDDKKTKKMNMVVTHKSLTVKEEATGKLIASFPISKVTYCNVDTTYEKAFVFVARERKEKPFKAYIFLCDTKNKAQEVFKTLSLAFKMNYESFQATAIREAALRSYARCGLDDIETELRAPNGHADLNGFQNVADTERSLENGSSGNKNPLSSDKDFKAIDKRVGYLQNYRIRSNTDPLGTQLMSASSFQCGEEGDFDEFTQLAKSRSGTVYNPTTLHPGGQVAPFWQR
ncbi:hypothetical protein QZH41_006908 [Actinostola sp. cb2023]|nr:hypothetical protein QZH41_006908 [Actinostola sp. cb2023]